MADATVHDHAAPARRGLLRRVQRAFFRLVKRAVLWLNGTRTFARVAPHVVPPVDRFVHRVSGGRMLLSEAMLPAVLLVTTGRRTGKRREVPVMTMPDGDHFIVVASNFGRERHPAWSANLLATPAATVHYRGEVIPVEAHLLDGDEKAAIWSRLQAMWPVFRTYRERTAGHGREIRVFRLERRAA